MKNNIDVFDTLTLDDNNKYLVSAKAVNDGKNYFLLVDTNNNANVLILEEFLVNDEIHMRVVEDKNVLDNIMPLFLESAKNSLETLKSE